MANDFFWLSEPAEPEPILRDAFDGWITGNGIFDAMASVADMPWKDAESVDSDVLDIAYFGNHSGGKFCSPIVKMLLNDDGEVPIAGRAVIAKIIVSKYLINWNKLWATNVAVYSPIHNYDMYEERDLETTEDNVEDTDVTLAKTGTDALQHGKVESTQHGKTLSSTLAKTGTDTLQHGKVETTQHGKTLQHVVDRTEDTSFQHGLMEETDYGKSNEKITSRYGLNTETQNVKPSDLVEESAGGMDTVTQSGTDYQDVGILETTTDDEGGRTVITDSGSDVQTKNLLDTTSETEGGTTSVTDSGTDTQTKNLLDTTDGTVVEDKEGTEHEEIHRYGNIGVTTSQKLLQEERELWIWNFFDEVFRDMDKELALAFHDPCRV